MDNRRRTFLKSAGLAGAGLLVGGPVASRCVGPDFDHRTRPSRIRRFCELGTKPAVIRRRSRSSCSTDFPTMCARGTAWCRRSSVPAIGCSCRTCAATDRRAFATLLRRAWRSRRRLARTSIDLADALGLARFAVAGYDWGGRAAAIAAALHPERVRATVLIGGYTIQNTLVAAAPGSPEAEHRAWYQWYFNTERGRAGLQANRRALCRYLWQLWSPSWHFTDAGVRAHRRVVRQSRLRRSRDPLLSTPKRQRARRSALCRDRRAVGSRGRRFRRRRSRCTAPTTVLRRRRASRRQRRRRCSRRWSLAASFLASGHFLPRERPEAVSSALLELLGSTR